MTKPVSIKPTAVATLQGVKIESPLNINKLQLVAKGIEAPKGFDLYALLACKSATDVAKLNIMTTSGCKVSIDRLVIPSAANGTSQLHLFGIVHDQKRGNRNGAWHLDGTSFDARDNDLQCGGQSLVEYWVNIRRKADGSVFIGNTLHKEKKTAFKYANQGRTECIATVSIKLPPEADISMLSLEQPAEAPAAPTKSEEVSETTTA